MSQPGGILPRPERGLNVRSSALAERVLGELALADSDILVVTRSCPHALKVAEIYGERVRRMDELWVGAAWADLGEKALIVVGSDVEVWPPVGLEDAAGASMPMLRWGGVPSGDSLHADSALVRADGPKLHVWESSPHPTSAADGWYPARCDVGRPATGNPFCYEALAERVLRLGRWFRHTPVGASGAPLSPLQPIPGCHVLVCTGLGGDMADLPSCPVLRGWRASVANGPAEMERRLSSERVDVTLIHSCAINGTLPDVLSALETGTAHGVPTLVICGCHDVAMQPNLQPLAINLKLDFSAPIVHRGLCHALVERLAWLADARMDTGHIPAAVQANLRVAWRS